MSWDATNEQAVAVPQQVPMAMNSEQVDKLMAALAKAQASMENPIKNKQVDIPLKTGGKKKYQYADLASIRDHARKALGENGLCIVHQTVPDMGGLSLKSTLFHESGQWTASLWPLNSGVGPQELGIQLTYGRRYNTTGLLHLAAEDDTDGDAETDHKPTPRAAAQAQQQHRAPAPAAAAAPRPATQAQRPQQEGGQPPASTDRSTEEMHAMQQTAQRFGWKPDQLRTYLGVAFKVIQPQRLTPEQYALAMQVLANQTPDAAVARVTAANAGKQQQQAKPNDAATAGDGDL